MTYKLISNGQLLKSANEKIALQAIAKVTRLSSEKSREIFLSGRRIKVSSAPERETLDKVCALLRKAGVDVEVVKTSDVMLENPLATEASTQSIEAPEPTQSVDTQQPDDMPANKVKRSHLLVTMLALLVIFITAAAGYGWYWLYLSESKTLLQAENTLADGNLVAVGYIDVEKMVVLNEHMLGGADPNALPVSKSSHDLLKRLFSGPADFKENLKQFVFSVHVAPEEKLVSTTMLLAGHFDQQQIVNELGQSFEVTSQGESRWRLIEKAIIPFSGDAAHICDEEEEITAKAVELTLYIAADWMMVSSDPSYAEKLWQRLTTGADATQDLLRWHNYRKGQIAAVMAFVPDQAVQAVTGMPGMIARGATQQAPHMNGLGAAAAVDIPAASLNLNFTLFSNNQLWNTETVAKARTSLNEMQADSLSVSPTMAALFSRVTLADSNEHITVDVALDSNMLGDVENIVQEGMASLFTPTISVNGNDQPAQEEIKKNLADYNLYAGLTTLPEINLEQFKHQPPPQFIDGPYAVSFNAINYQEGDYFTLKLDAKVNLVPGRNFLADSTEKITFDVTSIQSKSGDELLSDERCSKPDNVYGPMNHEPQTYFSAFNDQAGLSKELRLKAGVYPQEIDKVSGKLTFSAPTIVSKFQVPLKAGETVEHAGMRFYLSSIKGTTLNYHLSGDHKRLLEIRALNKQGQPLRSGWSMGDSSGGRSAKNFKGEISAIELYIADEFFTQEKPFLLTEIFDVPEKEKGKGPVYFAPQMINPKTWSKYNRHNIAGLKIDPKKWHVWGQNKLPVAEAKWLDAKMYITHTPQGWGNSPQAHLYFPMLMELPGVLSALSSTVEIPAHKDGVTQKFSRIGYPYRSNSGEISIQHKLNGMPVAYQSIQLSSGLEDNKKLDRLKGEVTFRLPTKTTSTTLPLSKLWPGHEANGIKTQITGIGLTTLPGYNLKVEGNIETLVNLHGITVGGERIIADPINFQSDGYWTMILPLNKDIEAVELITADKQRVIRLPFDLRADYRGQ